MTSISDIRATGTELLLTPRPIYEPINAPESLLAKLGRFGENYDLSTGSHLFRFLVALCGDAGAGAIKRELLYPKLQSSLESTHFSDLDRLYGDPLALPRLSEEIYRLDPKSIAMTQAEWQDVLTKDAQYRARCLIWMRAIMEGPTPQGIALAAEAACGYECDVVERYQYLENISSDSSVMMTNIGLTNALQEFVIVPRAPVLTESDRRRIMRLVDRIRPVNTIFSVQLIDDVRSTRDVRNVSASSEYFTVTRFVTGSPDIDWPAVNLSQGYWIEGGVEKEAPTFAWFNRQETATFLSIAIASASSEHIGPFDADQTALFSHLQDIDATHIFSPSYSFAKAFTPIQLSSPWVRTQNSPLVLVNVYYPLGYFADNTISQLTEDDPHNFWASLEADAPMQEALTFDLSTNRPVNFLDFEICQKPIDFLFEYSLDGVTWTEFEKDENFEPCDSVHYLPSLDYSWYYTEHHFNLVQARYIRVTFTRRTDPFPLLTSKAFPWSIEVRNLRLAHTVANADEFVVDTGADILGNTYRTDIEELPATNVGDGNFGTFWQSQANPVPDAVESLYFDLRINATPGTMEYLEEAQYVGGYDDRGMSDMESFVQDGIVVDEIYIDPVTFGPTLHIYYSNDTDPDFEDKLWTPIPRSFILKKGYVALPTPIYARFIKLEFSRLTPSPYHSLDYPVAPTLTYRRFPAWVQEHFDVVYENQKVIAGTFDNPFERVTIDPLVFGFQIPQDQLSTSYQDIRGTPPSESENEIRTFISNIVGTQTNASDNQVQQVQESDIQFFGSLMWQQDLLSQLDLGRAYSRYVANSITPEFGNINAELPMAATPPPTVQSVSNLDDVRYRKEAPMMFFPRTCRHAYQVVRSTRPTKVAYFVAIREVGFYRRNFLAQYNEPVYYETLDDESHIITNNFTRDEWRYVITP